MKNSMKNWTIQELEKDKNGYEGWNSYCIRAENNVHIATVGHVDRFSEKDTIKHARLISAAPKLLEACKTVNKDISRFRSTYVRPVTLEKIRQAIAKAEGGE